MTIPLKDVRIRANSDNADTNDFIVLGDSTVQSVHTTLWVWDATEEEWVEMTQPFSEADDLTTTMADLEKLLANNYWKDKRFDWTSGDLDYLGLNATHKAATSATSWYVWKFTWSGSNPTRIEGPLTGSWDGRASLAWAS